MLRLLIISETQNDLPYKIVFYIVKIYIKRYLKAKEKLWKLKYFTMQKYNLHKNPLKQTKVLQDIITLL
jgi:hypothetical protein